ncbi:hypothetical protein [Brevundimonas sp.]|uniref:hypothetical protein n=1 Tax=Brevundimonas sp. TaxID=1871086 RepID=UPI0025F6F6ED|nr:hypothetical protein [Brevundimonas sp.]
MRHVLTALVLVLVAACAPAPAPVSAGDQWSEAPVSAPPAPPDSPEARACADEGGTLRPVCRMQSLQCVVEYSDAGRACRDGDDCQGDCRADVGAQGQSVVGQCQASSDPCGCFAVVENGRVEHALCVD